MRKLLDRFSSLERAIANGLAATGGRGRQLAHWVATGEPTTLDVAAFKRWEVQSPDDGSRQAMTAAVASADPAVEWRLGQLRQAPFMEGGSFQTLQEIHNVRNAWPDDERLQALFDIGGIDGVDVLREFLTRRSAFPGARDLRRRPLFIRLAREHPDVLTEVLWGEPRDAVESATALADLPADALNPIAAAIADLACDASKQRRHASAHLIPAVDAEAIVPHLRRLALEATGVARAEAVRAWGDVVGWGGLATVIEFCDSHLGNDRSDGLQRAIADLREQALAPAPPTPAWPDVDDGEPSEDERRVFWEVLESRYSEQLAPYEDEVRRLRENPPSRGGNWPLAVTGKRPERIPDSLIEHAWDFVRTGEFEADLAQFVSSVEAHDPVLMRFGLVRMFRILRLAGYQRRFEAVFHQLADRCAATGHPTLLEVQAAAEAAGYSRDAVIAALPENPSWEPDQIGQWALAVLPSIIEIITWADSWEFGRPDRYYRALTTLPELSPKLRQLLVEQAVGSSTSLRPMARLTLAAFPGAAQAALEALSSRRYSERAEAANWLAELGAVEAIPALQAAAGGEPHDAALEAELAALVNLGESIDPYLDPDVLLARAQSDADKLMPADGDWIPLDALPSLRWRDGSPVDRAIVDWLVARAVRAKTASASPVVRLLFQRMERDTVTSFCHTVLALWIEHDLQPIGLGEANTLAAEDVAWARREREFSDLDDETLLERMLARRIEQPAGSAAGSAGLLSLPAAGGDHAVVAPAAAYVEKWSGRRASQSTALIEMLAWVDDPGAVRFVLSVGDRFPTKGIQAEAMRQAELLAERNGWTLDELELRMVPDGGFDADGRLSIDDGSRAFEARLGDDLKIALRDESGKVITTLPAARTTEDDEQVAAAKADLTASKKQIAAAADEQPLRLRDAMCTQRRFTVDDFERYIIGHPVMRRLAARLVWAAEAGHGASLQTTLFRPLSDGALVDVAGEEISIHAVDWVRLAHEAVDGRTEADRWKAHLVDYDVDPLFAQFDRPEPGPLTNRQTEWTGCRGAVIDDGPFRGVITTVGFQTGTIDTDHNVVTIERRFPASGLSASVEIDGLRAEEFDTEVVINSLGFFRLDDDSPVLLAYVPPALLAETIADLQTIAAAGDPSARRNIAW